MAENNSREEEGEGNPLLPLVECRVMHIHEEFAERLLLRTSATLREDSTLVRYPDELVTAGILKARMCESRIFNAGDFTWKSERPLDPNTENI